MGEGKDQHRSESWKTRNAREQSWAWAFLSNINTVVSGLRVSRVHLSPCFGRSVMHRTRRMAWLSLSPFLTVTTLSSVLLPSFHSGRLRTASNDPYLTAETTFFCDADKAHVKFRQEILPSRNTGCPTVSVPTLFAYFSAICEYYEILF